MLIPSKAPIVLLDLETTGVIKPGPTPLEQQPFIIEFAAVKLDAETLEEVETLEFFVNPGVPIPADATKVNGITDAMVKDAKSFPGHFRSLQSFFLGAGTMGSHNLSFETEVLGFELRRLNRLLQFPWPPIHVCTVETTLHLKGFKLNLSALHELATGKPHKEGAHRAMGDVRALATCYRWARKEGIVP